MVNAARTPEPPVWLDDTRVEIASGSRWWAVERALNRRGRSVPVLADYLDLSVGGLLSVGGYGVDSLVHGAAVDHVERLRVIRPDGTPVWCSPEEHPELFRYSLAGLGQVALIDRVVLRTKPYRRMTTLFSYRHDSLADMVRSFEWMTRADGDRPDAFKAFHSRGRFTSTYGVYSDTFAQAVSARPPAGLPLATCRHRLMCPGYRFVRSLTVSIWVRRFGRQRRLWCDYMLDYAGLLRFAGVVQGLLAQSAAASACLKSVYFLGVRRPPGGTRFPLEAAGNAGPRFLVGFYFMVPDPDQHALRSVEHFARACLEQSAALGGRPYLYGWHRFDADTLRQIYGADYDGLMALRRELDPDERFQTEKLLASEGGVELPVRP